MTRKIDHRLLATLLAVLRHGSITGAATALGYVPSAVSQQIGRLERQVGIELLCRKPGGGVTPTSAGRALADGAAHVLAAAADFQQLVDSVASAGAAELRVCAYPSAASELMPSALARIRARRSDVAIRLLEMEPAEGQRLLRAGEVDLLVAYRYLPDDPPSADDLRIVGLGREPLRLVGAAGGAATDLAGAAHTDWVAGHPGMPDRRLLQRWSHEAGLAPNVRYETDDYRTALALIAQRLAIGFVPASVLSGWCDARRPVAAIEGVPAERLPGRDVLAITRSRYRHPAAEELIAILRAGVAGYAKPA